MRGWFKFSGIVSIVTAVFIIIFSIYSIIKGFHISDLLGVVFGAILFWEGKEYLGISKEKKRQDKKTLWSSIFAIVSPVAIVILLLMLLSGSLSGLFGFVDFVTSGGLWIFGVSIILAGILLLISRKK